MSSTKTVWVLDIHPYLEYLEQCFDQLGHDMGWLKLHPPIDYGTGWKDIYQPVSYTPREELINWILHKELHEVFLLPTDYPAPNQLFERAHNRLVCLFNLNWYTSVHLFIPKFYGEITSQQIHRQGCWLYLENEIVTHENQQHALSPVCATPIQKQFLY